MKIGLFFLKKDKNELQDKGFKPHYICNAKTDYRARLVVQKAAKSSLSFFRKVSNLTITATLSTEKVAVLFYFRSGSCTTN